MGMKVLDVGCGLSPLLRYFTNFGCETFGLDLNKEVLKILTDKGSYLQDARINYVTQSGTHLGFQDKTFDLIVCISVLEHLRREDNVMFLNEMLRVLAPGGLLVITIDFNGSHGSDLKTVNILNRVLKQFVTIMALGLKNFDKNVIRQFISEVTSLRSSNNIEGPYSIKEVCKYLLMPISNLLESGETEICHKLRLSSLNFLQIKKFWEAHGFEGCSYLRARVYVPLGFTIKKLEQI